MSKKVPTARIVGGLLLAFGIFQIIFAIYRGPSFAAFPRLDRYLPYSGALINIVLGIILLREKEKEPR